MTTKASGSSASGSPMPGEGAKVVIEGAEPAFLSKEQIKAANIKPTPPGQQPGGTLHQLGARPTRLVAKQLLPLYPLFAMVGLGLGLATWHASRSLQWPGTDVSKGKRKEPLMELEKGGEMESRYHKYFQGSHLRHLAEQPGMVGAVRDFAPEPPVLPGDEATSAQRTFSDKRAHVQG